MPRLKRRGHQKRFNSDTERRIQQVLESLRRQRRHNPGGPWKIPKSIASIVAIGRFVHEVRN
jgi:hypothetical protein